MSSNSVASLPGSQQSLHRDDQTRHTFFCHSVDKTHQHFTLTDTSTRTLFVVQYLFLRDSALATDHEYDLLDTLLSWLKEKSLIAPTDARSHGSDAGAESHSEAFE